MDKMPEKKPENAMEAARQAAKPVVLRRFFTRVETSREKPGCFLVLLDGKPLRTPGKNRLDLPGEGLAKAIAGEWDSQGDVIDLGAMPLTRLANAIVDGLEERRERVIDDLAAYAGTDLVCYRAEEPAGLVARQAASWDPVIDWAREKHGIRLQVTAGLAHVAQPEEALKKVRQLFDGLDVFSLGAMASLVQLTGSALLAMAVYDGALSAEAAWQAAHVDEDWQISKWGEDREAKARRDYRWGEMQAAVRLLTLAAPAVTF